MSGNELLENRLREEAQEFEPHVDHLWLQRIKSDACAGNVRHAELRVWRMPWIACAVATFCVLVVIQFSPTAPLSVSEEPLATTHSLEFPDFSLPAFEQPVDNAYRTIPVTWSAPLGFCSLVFRTCPKLSPCLRCQRGHRH